MNDRFATLNDAIGIAREMARRLPALAGDETKSGRTEWTKAVWRYFQEKLKEEWLGWTLYPKSEPEKGRVAGEFLVDFSLFDSRRGCRIACESEWGNVDRVDWAFDKLRAVKADIKILIFQSSHDSSVDADEIFKRVRGYLAESHHHHPGHEFYLFLQFDGDNAKLFVWEPEATGPFDESKLVITPLLNS